MKTAAVEEKERFTQTSRGADEAAICANTARLLSAAPQVIDNVLGSMLGLELHPPSTEIPTPASHGITASSHLRGAWEGVISVHCEKILRWKSHPSFSAQRPRGWLPKTSPTR